MRPLLLVTLARGGVMWRRMVAIVEKSPSSASGRRVFGGLSGEQRLARLQREGGDTTAQGRHVESGT